MKFKSNAKKASKAAKKETAKVNEKKRIHAILSSSYQDNKKASETLAKHGYTLDNSLSGQRAKVFTDQNGKAHVVYRGTQNGGDVLTDIALTLGQGKKTNRVKHSKKVYKQAQEKYGHQDVDTYGHSLGGYLAENSGNNKGKIVTFNKASIGEKAKPNQVDIRTKNDVVSMFTPKHKNLIEINGNKNVLKSHSVDVLK
jgi:hypothetical protein